MIDGATRFGAFRRIVLPLAAPGSWPPRLRVHPVVERVPLRALFITNVKLRTFPVGLSSFITGDVYGWGYLMAGGVSRPCPSLPPTSTSSATWSRGSPPAA